MTATEPASDAALVDLEPMEGGGPGRWIVLGVLGVVLLLGVALAVLLSSGRAPDRIAMLGRQAPAVELTTVDDVGVWSTSFAGKPVIVNFWNTWCEPCLQEAPALRAFADLHAGDDVALLAIVRDDEDLVAIRAYVEKYPSAWTVLLDPQQQAALGFGTRGQPETFAISPSGVVVAAQYGPASVRDLEVMLEAARAAG